MKPLHAVALAAALLFAPLGAFADEGQAASAQGAPVDGTPSDPSGDEPLGNQNPFLPGEQMIGLAAGAHIPVFLKTSSLSSTDNLYLGGSFSFSYQYFVLQGLSIGGNLSAAFNNTIGGLSVFTAPLGFCTSYWFAVMPFEFSVHAELGPYLMRYNDHGIVDPFAKAGVSAYYRITPAWSAGIQANFWFVPEIHYFDYASLTGYAGYVETSLSAVYHL
jgi:hypothetical protein